MDKCLLITYKAGVYPPEEISRKEIDYAPHEKTEIELLTERVKALEEKSGVNPI